MTMNADTPPATCELCHAQPATTTVFRREWQEHQPACEGCAAIHEDHERKRRRQNLEDVFRRCRAGLIRLPRGMKHDEYEGPPLPDWPWARFDNPTFRELADAVILEAAESWRIEQSALVLAAPTGAAKTASIVAWAYAEQARRLADVDAGGKPQPLDFVFTTGFELAKARAQHQLGAGEAPAVRAALDAKLLLLDEVGFEPMRDRVIFEVVMHRMNQRKPCVLTTGRTEEEFSERYGAATWRRFTETAVLGMSFPTKGGH